MHLLTLLTGSAFADHVFDFIGGMHQVPRFIMSNSVVTWDAL